MPGDACHRRGAVREQWRTGPDGLAELVTFRPGYNCPRTDRRGHGVHGMEISWYLRGPRGVLYYMLNTGWIPGRVYPGHGLDPLTGFPPVDRPTGVWVGYHAHVAQYDDQAAATEYCGYIKAPCYHDTWGIKADDLTIRFVRDGESAIWDELRALYEELKAPVKKEE